MAWKSGWGDDWGEKGRTIFGGETRFLRRSGGRHHNEKERRQADDH